MKHQSKRRQLLKETLRRNEDVAMQIPRRFRMEIVRNNAFVHLLAVAACTVSVVHPAVYTVPFGITFGLLSGLLLTTLSARLMFGPSDALDELLYGRKYVTQYAARALGRLGSDWQYGFGIVVVGREAAHTKTALAVVDIFMADDCSPRTLLLSYDRSTPGTVGTLGYLRWKAVPGISESDALQVLDNICKQMRALGETTAVDIEVMVVEASNRDTPEL